MKSVKACIALLFSGLVVLALGLKAQAVPPTSPFIPGGPIADPQPVTINLTKPVLVVVHNNSDEWLNMTVRADHKTSTYRVPSGRTRLLLQISLNVPAKDKNLPFHVTVKDSDLKVIATCHQDLKLNMSGETDASVLVSENPCVIEESSTGTSKPPVSVKE